MSTETRNASQRWERRIKRLRTDELRRQLGLPAYQWKEDRDGRVNL